MGFLRDIHTADAKSTVYDWVRVALSTSLLTGLGLVVYSVVWRSEPFDIQTFGIGIAAIIGAGGGAMYLRKDIERAQQPVEPENRDQP